MGLWYGVVFLFVALQILGAASDRNASFSSTVLMSDISSTSLVIPVRSAQAFSANGGMIAIDNERIIYSGISTVSTSDNPPREIMAFRVESINNRGAGDTTATAHRAGTIVFSERLEALNDSINFQQVNVESVWGKIQLPFQAVGFFSNFVAKAVTWDYPFFEGWGWYFKVLFLWPLSVAMMIGMLNLFKDMLSLLGVTRG